MPATRKKLSLTPRNHTTCVNLQAYRKSTTVVSLCTDGGCQSDFGSETSAAGKTIIFDTAGKTVATAGKTNNIETLETLL